MEIVFEIILEVAIYLIVELLTELGIRNAVKATRGDQAANPFLAAIGYAILAFVIGGVSLLIYPHHLIKNPNFRILSLMGIPVLSGFLMAYRGHWLRLKEKTVLKLDSFTYGFLFALVIGLLRYYAGQP